MQSNTIYGHSNLTSFIKRFFHMTVYLLSVSLEEHARTKTNKTDRMNEKYT